MQYPRLLITKLSNTFSTCSGGSLEYTVKVTNIGNITGKNLVLTDTLPNGFTYATTTSSVFTQALSDIQSYETKIITYVARVAPSTAPGEYINDAVVKVDNGQTPYNTAEARANIKVYGPCEQPSTASPILTITKSHTESFINPGNILNFTITVKNSGAETAYNVRLVDELPSGFSAVDKIVQWDLGDIGPNESKTITFRAKAEKTIATRIYTNIAKATASNHNEIYAQSNIEVRKGTVLGTNTQFAQLPNTGAGMKIIIYFIANFIAFIFGLMLHRRTKVYGIYG